MSADALIRVATREYKLLVPFQGDDEAFFVGNKGIGAMDGKWQIEPFKFKGGSEHVRHSQN